MVLLAVMLVGSCVAMADAKPASPPAREIRPQDLRRVDATEADVDPLRTSNRLLTTDLRRPLGFSEVYQVPKNAPGRYAGWFVRMDGAVIAVFPQSRYQESAEGSLPLIPNGTEFFIGGLPGARATDSGGAADRGHDRIDTSVSTSMSEPPVSGASPSTRVEPRRADVQPAGTRVPARAAEKPTDSGDPSAAAQALAARLARITERVGEMFTDDARRDQRVGRLLNRVMRPGAATAPVRSAVGELPPR